MYTYIQSFLFLYRSINFLFAGPMMNIIWPILFIIVGFILLYFIRKCRFFQNCEFLILFLDKFFIWLFFPLRFLFSFPLFTSLSSPLSPPFLPFLFFLQSLNAFYIDYMCIIHKAPIFYCYNNVRFQWLN